MKIKTYQIDAFTDKVFSGNPAAVCILDEELSIEKMQNIAAENNLAETAFVAEKSDSFEIRWFTPTVEVDLCGHATLASAFVLFSYYQPNTKKIRFISPKSGELFVEKSPDGMLTLDFPKDDLIKIENNKTIENIFGIKPLEVYKGKTDYMLIFSNQEIIENIRPNITEFSKLKARGVIVTSKGKEVDFVSRFFAPESGIYEDPVTGSAHTTLTPYWAKELNKSVLTAKQISKRGGELLCELSGNRIKISGKAVPYLIGEIDI